jgi:hypothetical protein
MDYPDFLYHYGQSWEKLVFQSAVRFAEQRTAPVQRQLGITPGDLAAALAQAGTDRPADVMAAAAAGNGLAYLWFSDDQHVVLADDDVTIHCRFLPGRGGTVTVAVRDDGAVARVMPSLRGRIHMIDLG